MLFFFNLLLFPTICKIFVFLLSAFFSKASKSLEVNLLLLPNAHPQTIIIFRPWFFNVFRLALSLLELFASLFTQNGTLLEGTMQAPHAWACQKQPLMRMTVLASERKCQVFLEIVCHEGDMLSYWHKDVFWQQVQAKCPCFLFLTLSCFLFQAKIYRACN